MIKTLIFLLLLGATLSAQTSPVPVSPAIEPWYHESHKYPSCRTGCSGKGAARAAKAGNRCSITIAQIGAGLLVAGLVTTIAALVTNGGTGDTSTH